jgi:DNA-binding transcriptional regulator YhcF (GntR family)
MVKTGYILFVTEIGGGQDTSGNPIPSTKTLSSWIPCNLNTIRKEYKIVVDGQEQPSAKKIQESK